AAQHTAIAAVVVAAAVWKQSRVFGKAASRGIRSASEKTAHTSVELAKTSSHAAHVAEERLAMSARVAAKASIAGAAAGAAASDRAAHLAASFVAAESVATGRLAVRSWKWASPRLSALAVMTGAALFMVLTLIVVAVMVTLRAIVRGTVAFVHWSMPRVNNA